jgi:hypothetical protein
MTWRKWLVRGVVFTILGAMVSGVVAYRRWTDPEVVRAQVISELEAIFPGALVSVDSARLRLLGGIAAQDIRLVRRDDPDKTVFAYIPSAIFFHDKERLLDGRLAIRKVELQRPRLRVLHSADGRWNVRGVISPPRLDEPIPSIVIRQGTVIVEDRATKLSPWEINNVCLTVANNPLPQGNFRATASSPITGKLQINGSWQRPTDATALTLQSTDLSVGPDLLCRLAAYVPALSNHIGAVTGNAQLRADVHYQPDQTRPWTHDVRFKLTKGTIHTPTVPLALSDVEATANCKNGKISLESLTGRSGAASVRLGLEAPELESTEPTSDNPWDRVKDMNLHIDHLALTSDFFDHAPPQVQKSQKMFAPSGTVSLDLQQHREGANWRRHVLITHEGVQATYREFPYTLDDLRGTIDHQVTSAGVDLMKVDLVGRSGHRPITIKGEIDGDGPLAGIQLDIVGADIPLDAKLEGALSPRLRTVAQEFRPKGLGNVVAQVRRAKGTKEFTSRYVIFFHDAAVRYQAFPYDLDSVSGTLDIQPDHWEFRDFHGQHGDAIIRTNGRSYSSPQGDRIAVEITGRQLALNDELAAAVLDPELKQAWKQLTPSGRMDFAARVDHAEGKDPDIDVTVWPKGVTVHPSFFPYTLSDLVGSVRYARRLVLLDKLQARHGNTQLTLDTGKVYVKPGGGIYAEIGDRDGAGRLHGTPIMPDDDFYRALPQGLCQVCSAVGLRDPLELHTLVVVDMPPGPDAQPVVYWDGEGTLSNAHLAAGIDLEGVSGRLACRGRYNGHKLEQVVGHTAVDSLTIFRQPFRDLHADFEVRRETPDLLLVPGLRASIFGGEVYGPLRVEFGDNPRFALKLTASHVQLEELGRHNMPRNTNEFAGLATAQLYLQGEGSDLNKLYGRGSLEVPKGKMYDLPLLLDLIKVLGMRRPDGTMFEEAYATFRVQGQRVQIDKLDMYGNAISLSGHGEMNLNGTDIDLDFYTVFGRFLQVLPPVLSKIPPTMSQLFFKIKMTGKMGDVKIVKEPVPVLVEPLKELLERLRGQTVQIAH